MICFRPLLLVALLSFGCGSISHDFESVRCEQECSLESTKLPDLNLIENTLPEALAQVETQVRAANPKLKGFRLIPSPKLPNRRFSLETETPMNVAQVLNWICLITDSKIVWQKDGILVAPDSEIVGSMEILDIKLPKGFLLASGTPAELRQCLIAYGIKFPPGSELKFTETGVSITHERAMLERCQNLLELLRQRHYQGQSANESCSWLERVMPAFKCEKMEREAIVEQILMLLRQKIDPKFRLILSVHGDPRSAPSVPDLFGAVPPSTKEEADRIDFHFAGGTVRELLEALCDRCNWTFRTEGNLLKLADRGSCGCYETHFYKLPGDFTALMKARLQWMNLPVNTNVDLSPAFFKSLGVELEPGENMQIISSVNQLVFTGSCEHRGQIEWRAKSFGPPKASD